MLKICLQVTYPTYFCIICIQFYYGKGENIWFFLNSWPELNFLCICRSRYDKWLCFKSWQKFANLLRLCKAPSEKKKKNKKKQKKKKKQQQQQQQQKRLSGRSRTHSNSNQYYAPEHSEQYLTDAKGPGKKFISRLKCRRVDTCISRSLIIGNRNIKETEILIYF